MCDCFCYVCCKTNVLCCWFLVILGTMIAVAQEQDGATGHIVVSKFPNEALKHVAIEWNVLRSVTRYIAAVPVNLEDAGIVIEDKSHENKLYYVIHQAMLIQMVVKLMWQIVYQ